MTPDGGAASAEHVGPPEQEPSGLTRRRMLMLGGAGAVTAGAYAVSRGPDLQNLLRSAGFAEPAPPELRIEPRPADHTSLTARRQVGAAPAGRRS